LGAPFAFWEADIHKIKGRGKLSRSHKDLNSTDDNTGLTERFSTSTELWDVCAGILKISFDF
jgi:hypothetical protein